MIEVYCNLHNRTIAEITEYEQDQCEYYGMKCLECEYVTRKEPDEK